jgi:hypothetical protein
MGKFLGRFLKRARLHGIRYAIKRLHQTWHSRNADDRIDQV